ncbi:MAG: hypothetical protein HS117_20925 [Verrucomicrobiaceae bacterium]|nr:hypothetical protein [Verrucomicrobiaceae bacterium]
MPEGLLAALGEENVLNLIACLMGEGQVEMSKRARKVSDELSRLLKNAL